MNITIYEVNAFSEENFAGNPAAVCLLNNFLPDTLMQSIAAQNNLSETAFIVHDTENKYFIRWFAPENEVDLCGHATLAAAYVIFKYLNSAINAIQFNSKSGLLDVYQEGNEIELNFPALFPQKLDDTPLLIRQAINYAPQEVFAATDYLVILNNEEEVKNLVVDMNKLSQLDRRGVIFTAPGVKVDFVSRVFHPKLGIGEDPVCGSAHCQLAPYWGQRLQKNNLRALQLSQREGSLFCTLDNQRVLLKRKCNLYLKGEIFL